MNTKRVYMVVRRAWARHANLLTGPGVLGGPPVMAAALFGHAIERRMRARVDDPCFATARVLGTALVLHERSLLGETHKGRVQFQQRRAASFVAERKARSRDYAGSQGYALSLQPTAEAHWCVSLVFEISIDQVASVDAVRRAAAAALHGARLAGGRLEVPENGLAVGEDAAGAFDHIGHGWVVVDVSGEALGIEGATASHDLPRVPALVDAVLPVRRSDTASRTRAAAVLGYGAIEAPVPADARHGVREGAQSHAFVEPLLGVVEYRPYAQVDALETAFWRMRFDPEVEASERAARGLFVLFQDRAHTAAASETAVVTSTGETQ